MKDAKVATRLWSTLEVAAFLGVPVGTIYSWRNRGDGPPAYKVVGVLRYDRDEVIEWLHGRRTQETVQ